MHICHASDSDIAGIVDKPVISRWEPIKMPSAPLIRLELVILDRPEDPYRFESFLNVAAYDRAQVLVYLANQDELHLAFYGDGLQFRYTKSIPHTEEQWQQLDDLVEQAARYREEISVEQHDFDRAELEKDGLDRYILELAGYLLNSGQTLTIMEPNIERFFVPATSLINYSAASRKGIPHCFSALGNILATKIEID